MKPLENESLPIGGTRKTGEYKFKNKTIEIWKRGGT